MERLTEKLFGFVQLKACGNDFCKETCSEHDEEKSCKNCPIQKAFEKLAEYEDLEEQGLLLHLNCKMGDSIWYVDDDDDNYPIEAKITGIEIKENYILYFTEEKESCGTMGFINTDFGETVFLTYAEAEQKLKEMEV